jgi:chromate transporter
MKDETEPRLASEVPAPTFGEALRYWFKLGCISFGGPAGQIALMHRDLVEKRRWISDSHFLHALNFCMLLPGPEAQQLATYLGWRLHGAKGGIAAGALFVLPSAFLLLLLSWIYMSHGTVAWVAALFQGLLPAVMAVVAAAVHRIGGRALRTPAMWLVAALSFVAIFYFKISFVIILLVAAVTGWLGHMLAPRWFPVVGGHGGKAKRDEPVVLHLPTVPRPTWKRASIIVTLGLLLWWSPVLLVGFWLGWQETLFQQGVFFSKAALVTFGGAYAVLPYVAQQAVETHGWLTHAQMMSGLGLAETTPGPLIMVLQFVGYVGGWQNPGGLSAPIAAVLGSAMTTWVTFVPCFLFVFIGGPYVEHLGKTPRLGAALTGITAAVVGVIVNLAVWFGWHTLWPSGWVTESWMGGIDWPMLLLAIASFVALHRYKWNALSVIAMCAAAGLGLHLAGW